MKRVRRLTQLVAVFAIVMAVHSAALVPPVHAQDDPIVVQPPCDEAAFDTAMTYVQERAGGTVVFNCGGAATINFTSVKTVDLPTTIDGAGQITLSGGNSTQLFLVDTGDELTLRGLTLTLGYSPGDGGAIENNGTLNIENSTIQDSNAVGSGGAIVSYGPLSISDSTLEGNRAANAGAIYPRFPAATTTIVNSNLVDNHATSTTDGWGGAILAWDGANVTIYGGTIAGNSARVGGGIHNRFANSTIILRGVLVLGNQTKANTLTADLAGGGIYNGPGTVTVEKSVFGDNDAAWTGGGIYSSGGVVAINDSTFTRNTALADGGAMSNAGNATVKGTLFRNNSSVSGSTVSNWSELLMQNVTFSGNTVREKAVFINYGEAVIQNTTFSDNLDETGQPGASQILQWSQQPLRLKNVVLKVFVGGFGGFNCSASTFAGDAPITSDGFNVSDDTRCSAYFTNAGDKNNTDPKLGPLADNGGPTLTHLPLPGSPLIDGGQCIVGLTTDQRGVARPQGGACDVGAVEVRPEDQAKKLFLPSLGR
jgi:hypothetical protein